MHNFEKYQKNKMQKERIIEKLKERGCRITKQRRLLLDIILEEKCSCCKEIYYKASQIDRQIGSATVYRMINMLEEIGAISRENMYRIDCEKACALENACTIELDDNTVIELSEKQWKQIVRSGLVSCGYLKEQRIKNVVTKSDKG